MLAVTPKLATLSKILDGKRILPIEYGNKYITIYPGETMEIHGTIWKDANPRWVRIEGVNTPAFSINIKKNKRG